MDTPAARLLDQEARSLLTRLALVRSFSLTEPMVLAAAPSDAAATGIERYLSTRRNELRERVLRFLAWLRGPGRAAAPDEMQRRFTFLRLRFNTEITQFELFADALSQRGDAQLGTWLAGMDVAAEDALALPGMPPVPPLLCYVDQGLGGAIRRARTRLPGGGENPVAIVRMPRERMVGAGIASSLMHEVGHQAASVLDLLPGLIQLLGRRAEAAPPAQRETWLLLTRWISEVAADFWAVGTVGIASTHGLVSVLALPKPFVFRGGMEDPHPIPWVRVHLSCAMGDALYPDPQWAAFAAVWRTLYPEEGLAPEARARLAALLAAAPEFVRLLAEYRPAALAGRSLAEVFPLARRQPARLLADWRELGGDFDRLREAAPAHAFAMVGQARASGLVTPEEESPLLRHLLTYWALRRSLNASAARTQASAPPAARPALLTLANGGSR
jgi:hypothetical protein